jgi:hypothetical protein
MNGSFKKTIAIISFLGLVFPSLTQADDFDFNRIITDAEAGNYNSMGQLDVRDFLREKDSYLRNYWYSGNNPAPSQVAQDPDEKYIKKRTAYEIIYNAAQEAKINPQFLLTMLQKEMSLVEDEDPTDRQLAYAMGYYCYDGQACNPKFKGFGKQVRSAALQFRYYIDNIDEYKYQPGMRSCVDDQTPYLPCTSSATEVRPDNNITAAMYVYTPHIHGNKLFATIWNRYGFGGVSVDPNVLSGIFPQGSLVKAKDGEDLESVYLIINGQKRLFESTSALVSRFSPSKVLLVGSEELLKYVDGEPIQFTNFTVLEAPNGNKYLIDGLQKRRIVSDEAFRQLGFNPAEVEEVTSDQLDSLEDGEDLDENNASPFEEIFKDMTTGSISYVKDGKKWSVIDMEILELNHPGVTPREVTTKTLEQFEYMGALKLADGTLIKKDLDKDVYVVSAGERRLIPDGNTFETLGYQWGNIVTVSKKILNFHKVGTPLESL